MATSLSSLGSLGEYFGKKKIINHVFGQINTWGAGTWIFSMLLTLFCSLQGLSWCKTQSKTPFFAGYGVPFWGLPTNTALLTVQ